MILITGAFGQVGKILQEKLDESYNLILVDIKEDKTFKTRASSQILIGDLQNFDFVNSIFKKYKFDFVFNLATNSFVEREIDKTSQYFSRCKIFENIMDSILYNESVNKTWVFHPLSSEIFGNPKSLKQGHNSKISPISPYGIQKSIELLKCRYLNHNGFKIFHPILFNHESKYRSFNFFTKKIICSLNKFSKGEPIETITFYNAKSSRDFGYAYDFVEIFIIAMNKKITGDEIIGSGINFTVLDFIKVALEIYSIDYNLRLNDFGLHEFIINDKILIKEIHNDINDNSRCFCFDGVFINNCFKDIEVRGGSQLVGKLIEDEK